MSNTTPNPRENFKYYIPATDQDIKEMLMELGLKELDELFSHIDPSVTFNDINNVAPEIPYNELLDHLKSIADKNQDSTSFIGDGLHVYSTPSILGEICNIRGLTTAYTPYQPERSQGTLQTLWIYQSALAHISGFEAINASLYERSTCLFEALNCATRLKKKCQHVIVAESIYPGDIEVLNTLAKHTKLKIHYAGIDQATGKTDFEQVRNLLNKYPDTAAIAFPQINNLGVIEDFDLFTDLCTEKQVKSICLFDPIAVSNNMLKEPRSFGKDEQGTDMIVAEGQHLVLGANFGGPGLGIFGIRYHDKDKTSIRSTAGRYVGKTKDSSGRECKALILSTREQHIRREKATSNICSNQSFIASAAGACILSRGSSGLEDMAQTAFDNAHLAFQELTKYQGIDARFPFSTFFNEFTLKVENLSDIIIEANNEGIEIGVNISGRLGLEDNLLLINFTDRHVQKDLEKLLAFFDSKFDKEAEGLIPPTWTDSIRRRNKYLIKTISGEEVIKYYQKLGKQNLSPDDGIYPLGSCTMKYNPYINDEAASLSGFTNIHPQSSLSNSQGCLEILYQTQEIFKNMTGLPGVTTQPLAGAQGELVGLKMFQAYHADKNEVRDIILIPRSAHGTNPATATMAGFESKMVDGVKVGIVTVDANKTGEMDIEQIKGLIKNYGNRIAGIMVTNPNTSGIFESNFKLMADLIHGVDGLVYMDGANMNAIAGWVNLQKLGVDAVHNNLHKTWTIPHGGGGPGDAIVAVSEKLIDYLPGVQVEFDGSEYKTFKPNKSIGSFHRHYGNFAHKVRGYTYLRALGPDGIRKMAAVAVLSARYLYHKLKDTYPTLPEGSENTPRMHEFIITLQDELFNKISDSGTPVAKTIGAVGKLFLDFGFHAPTVAFPEPLGLMIEPTESYSKKELDEFCEMTKSISQLLHDCPEVLSTAPHFTPVDKVDELTANKSPNLSESLNDKLTEILEDRIEAASLRSRHGAELAQQIINAHQALN